MSLAFMSFGVAELLLVGVVALIVFGGNLPDVMRTLGRSYARLRQSLHEFSRPVREEMREVTRLPPPSAPPVPREGDDEAARYPDYYEEQDAQAAEADEPHPPADEAPPEPKTQAPDLDEPPTP